MLKKFIFSLGLGGVLASGACAINFGTTAVVDGTTYTIGAGPGVNGISVQKIGDTLSFGLPNGVAVASNKQIKLEYFVVADAGNTLSKITQIAGNGSASAPSSVGINTSFLGAVNETAPTINYPGGSSFPPVSYSFTSSPVQWNKVTTIIDLNGLDSFAKVSTYSANYTQVVPEPLTTAALVTGLAGLVARRKKK
jgi:hypothetical protein